MSNERKWTKGPWTVRETPETEWQSDDVKEWGIYTQGDEWPLIEQKPYYSSAPESIHDAHLIAAAPDLYEALSYARRFMKEDQYDLAFIDAALARARGEK